MILGREFYPPVLILFDLENKDSTVSDKRASELYGIEYLVQVQEKDSRVLKDPGREENQFSRDHNGKKSQ